MRYDFIAQSTICENRKAYISIPFNVWKTCGRKGMINTKVCINNYPFECRLIPKGEGFYYIPINKTVQKNIKFPKLCILIDKRGECSHFLVHYDSKYFYPSVGELDTYDSNSVVGYLEILL